MSEECNERVTVPFAIVLPSELDLTAPVAACIELSKMYIEAYNNYALLKTQQRVEHIPDTDAEGNDYIRIIVHKHPKESWWFDQCRKILTDIGKINNAAEAKVIDQKIRMIEIFNSNKSDMPPEVLRAMAIAAMREKEAEN